MAKGKGKTSASQDRYFNKRSKVKNARVKASSNGKFETVEALEAHRQAQLHTDKPRYKDKQTVERAEEAAWARAGVRNMENSRLKYPKQHTRT